MDRTEIQQEIIEKKEKEKTINIDFKMVTFTLAGRDYALDIMKVKEISKANKFTYVPNASPFVRGVYNLRGDIISVIDLRIFFNQVDRGEINREAVKMENMIILRLEDHVIAVIVDTIEKVVGVNKEEIQPPHPLFGDINIKYISGVVEKNEKLYVILDVEKIFNSDDTPEVKAKVSEAIAKPTASVSTVKQPAPQTDADDINLNFILESLQTFKLFYPSAINQDWVKKRFKQWKSTRESANKEVQFTGENDAREFLQGFSSSFDGILWDTEYCNQISSFISEGTGGNFTLWNPGCGKGAESYSIAAMLKMKNPQWNLKILANDNDLINISTAPGLVFGKEAVPSHYNPFMVESSSGLQFNKEIKDAIIFEYHDIIHDNNLPPLDMVVMRDVLSHLPGDKQKKILGELEENVKPGGLLLLGKNEKLSSKGIWEPLDGKVLNIYKKK